MRTTFRAELWDYEDDGGWHFVSLPEDVSEELRDRRAPGFGSIRVQATIGATTWETSVFPSKDGPYLLPVKKPVRRAEQVEAGDLVTVDLEVIG